MRELIKQHKQLDKVAKLYLVSQFLRGLYFAWPIWYAFASQALTPLQVGVYFSMFYGVQLVAEVPTGAYADKYGRKRSALIGSFILIFMPLIVYFGHTFPAYLFCAVLSGIGWAFISGSLEALVYDHKNVSKEAYRMVAWLEITFLQTGLIVSTATGGFMYQLNSAIPFMAEAIAALTCFIIVTLIHEVPIEESTRPKEAYIRYFKTGIKHLLATKYLRVVVLMGVPVAVMMTICVQFVNEAQMIAYGLEPPVRGLLLASVKVIALLVINLVFFSLLRFDHVRLLFISIIGTTIFLLLGVGWLPLFLVGFVVFNWLSTTQECFIKPILQDKLPSSHRATAMSGYSALTGFVAVGGNVVAGGIIQTFGTPRAVYILFACVFIMLVVPCSIWLTEHLKDTTDRSEKASTI